MEGGAERKLLGRMDSEVVTDCSLLSPLLHIMRLALFLLSLSPPLSLTAPQLVQKQLNFNFDNRGKSAKLMVCGARHQERKELYQNLRLRCSNAAQITFLDSHSINERTHTHTHTESTHRVNRVCVYLCECIHIRIACVLFEYIAQMRNRRSCFYLFPRCLFTLKANFANLS
jgi:hypothetical protein